MNRSNLYSQVLNLYKRLYKTRNQVFQDDINTLQSSLSRLRNDFRLNQGEKDQKKIEQLIKTGKEVDRILRTQVLQTIKLKEKPNVYQLKVKKYMLTENHTSK